MGREDTSYSDDQRASIDICIRYYAAILRCGHYIWAGYGGTLYLHSFHPAGVDRDARGPRLEWRSAQPLT